MKLPKRGVAPANAGHTRGDYQVVTDFKNVGEHRHNFSWFFFFYSIILQTHKLDELPRQRERTSAVYRNNSTALVLQTQDHTDKRKWCRKRNIEDDQGRQLAILASTVFSTQKTKIRKKNMGEIPAEKTVFQHCERRPVKVFKASTRVANSVSKFPWEWTGIYGNLLNWMLVLNRKLKYNWGKFIVA